MYTSCHTALTQHKHTRLNGAHTNILLQNCADLGVGAGEAVKYKALLSSTLP